MHRKEQVLAQRIHTFSLKTNNSVKSHKKQSFLWRPDSLVVLVDESTCHAGKGAKLKARRKERVLGQMLLRFFVKRHNIVKSHNKHTSCGLSLCVGGGIDMVKAPKQLGASLGAWMDTFFLREILVGLKSSYLGNHEDFNFCYS